MERIDREQLADFLRRRREALQPEDLGLSRGQRRRTAGLRREEVAALCAMSTDYYTRLEQGRGPQPSESMLAAVARGLRLTRAERDHLFRLAGHTPPAATHRSRHVNRALMRVLDRLDTPAQVITDLGETLAQNELSVALVGLQTQYAGLARCVIYRWFLEPAGRDLYPPRDHALHSRIWVGMLRAVTSRYPDDEEAQALLSELLARSDEFRELWQRHEVTPHGHRQKRMVNPVVGEIELDCQVLNADDEGQVLLVYTATPGSEDARKLELLGVVGRQLVDAPHAG